MRRLQILLALAVSLGASWTASAVPISAYGGTLDATLRFFDIQHDDAFTTEILLLRAEYELGVDFMPAVPLSFQQSSTPYTGCVVSRPSAIWGNCFAWVEPVAVPGTDFFTGIYGEDPSKLGGLVDACAPGFGRFQIDGQVAMIARGTCAFSTKWENAEADGYAGVLVENNTAGPLGGIGLLPSANEPTIPFFLITQAVAEEIRAGTRGFLFDGSRDQNLFFPVIQMKVSWTPPPVEPPVEPQPVPEPATTLLSLTGLGCLTAFRRRRPAG